MPTGSRPHSSTVKNPARSPRKPSTTAKIPAAANSEAMRLTSSPAFAGVTGRTVERNFSSIGNSGKKAMSERTRPSFAVRVKPYPCSATLTYQSESQRSESSTRALVPSIQDQTARAATPSNRIPRNHPSTGRYRRPLPGSAGAAGLGGRTACRITR
jgi:hypothetical protein